MPKGSILDTTVRSSEDQVVDLIVFAISRFVEENEVKKPIGETKIAKIVYRTAEDLQLPVTRSWFKFGAYVWPQFDLEEHYNQFLGKLTTPMTVRGTIEKAIQEDRELFRRIEDTVSDQSVVFESDVSEFLDWLYSNEAPKEYRPLYKSHKKVLDRFEKVFTAVNSGFPTFQFLPASREMTDFHRRLLRFQDKPDMVDLVMETTALLEDLLVTYESNLDNHAKLLELVKFLRVLYSDFYLKYVWTFPASVITIETIDGPRKLNITEERNGYLKSLPRYFDRLSEFSKKAFEGGLYPSKPEILALQDRLSKNLGSDENALRTVFAESVHSQR